MVHLIDNIRVVELSISNKTINRDCNLNIYRGRINPWILAALINLELSFMADVADAAGLGLCDGKKEKKQIYLSWWSPNLHRIMLLIE